MQKKILLLTLSLLSVAAQATSVNEVFGPESACYTRSYSAAHLKSHPKQTVKNMRVNLFMNHETPNIKVEVVQTSGRKLTQWMACFDSNGKVICPVECDGGSMEIEGIEEGTLGLKNKGLIMSGGCGEDGEEISVYLKSLKGGDDYFNLNSAPMASCKGMKF